MTTRKLIGFAIAWIFASLAMAGFTSVVLTEVLDIVGVVEAGRSSYTVALNVIAVGLFLALIAVPFIFRGRFSGEDERVACEQG